MRASDIAVLVGVAAGVVLLIALDSKSMMTWFAVVLGVVALVMAIYAGVDLHYPLAWR